MRKFLFAAAACVPLLLSGLPVHAQYVSPSKIENQSDSTIFLSLEDALKIALSENVSVKVADKEVERSKYAKAGTYSSLFPQVSGSGAFQRTIKKQVMYMDFDMSSLGGMMGGGSEDGEQAPSQAPSSSSGGGIEVGRWNTFNAGISASMPLVNAQLWESLKISGKSVDLAVEQARSSRLDMVTQVKQAYFAVLLAKEAFNVYKSVYENAIDNFGQTEKRYKAQKASELDYTRAKTTVANAIPNVYNAENSVILALWQLKAVMGVDLDLPVDVTGSLEDYSSDLLTEPSADGDIDLSDNSTLRQLAIQADQLALSVKTQQYAYLPSLALAFSYSMNAMTNDFKFSEYRWTPYSYVGLSLSIPIFSGGKRLSDVRSAKVQATELDLNRQDVNRQLQIAVRQYLNTMQTNVRSYSSAQEAVSLAQKAYDISAKSYQLGKSTLTDLNDAQLALTQSSLACSQAVYNFLVAKSNLEKTLGHDFLQ